MILIIFITTTDIKINCFINSDKNRGPKRNKSSSSKSNHHDDDDHDDFFMDDGPSNLNDRQNYRSHHPPQLKGRDIGSLFIFYLNCIYVLLSYFVVITSGMWYARKQASMREDEELLDMGRPKVKPPPQLKGHDLDLWHKEQNRLWQQSKKKEIQKESGKQVSFPQKLNCI